MHTIVSTLCGHNLWTHFVDTNNLLTHVVDTICGHILWTRFIAQYNTIGGHTIWTHFVDTLRGHKSVDALTGFSWRVHCVGTCCGVDAHNFGHTLLTRVVDTRFGHTQSVSKRCGHRLWANLLDTHCGSVVPNYGHT